MIISKQGISIIFALSIVAFFIFLFSFFFFHKGLPTGDSQKSIIWAQEILSTGKIPNYQTAITRLNRDPVDFYTPALHGATAILLKIGGLTGVGVASIGFSLAAAAVGACLAYHYLPAQVRAFTPAVTFILILTHERFLRYLREPGYHFQNIIGELLLFTMLMLGLSLLRRWRWSALAGTCAAATLLIFSHQFSIFLAAFVLLPVAIALTLQYRRLAWALAAVAAAVLTVGILLGLHEKVPDIFTRSPHLLTQIPTFKKTIDIMGAPWLLLGLGGLVALLVQARDAAARTFAISSLILLILSQGPRFYLDIPPVRALFYSIIPLSVTGSYFLIRLSQAAPKFAPAVAALVIIFTSQSTASAFVLSHSVRTNSTLTPGQLELARYLEEAPGEGVLIDDYNRRSSSWLVLSGHPMFTRIAADLETQMKESQQSKLRHELYLNQLDYEKIYSLGSLPEITQLMEKQHITWVTGIDESSESSFARNPALQKVQKIDDITLFRFSSPGVYPPNWREGEIAWLLKPSTLANDIGDLEDTFEHLPASLRATRLSEPLVTGQTTYRTTSAPLIPLKFNVGDFVRVFWDQDNDHRPDSTLELLVRYLNTIEVRKISPPDALIDEEGFITLTIDNPKQVPLDFDLIALGFAPTP